MDIVVAPVAHASCQGELAGRKFGVRARAYLADLLVVNVLGSSCGPLQASAWVVLAFVEPPALEAAGSDPATASASGDMAMGLLLALLYFVACEWLFGATPGKLVCGLRVVMDDGSPCTLKAALIRGVVRFFDGLLFGLPAYLAMKPQEYRRAGDDLAHTLVVKASDLTPGRLRSKWRLLVALAMYMFVATSICGWYLMVLFIRG